MDSVAQLEQLNGAVSGVKCLNPTGAARAWTGKKKNLDPHDDLMNRSSPTHTPDTHTAPASASDAAHSAIARNIGLYQK